MDVNLWSSAPFAKWGGAVYSLGMEIQRITDSPFLWGAAGLIIGVALGVTTVSAWIMAVGLGGHLLYLRLRGPAQHGSEGMLFASGPAFMMAWLLGFVVRGLLT